MKIHVVGYPLKYESHFNWLYTCRFGRWNRYNLSMTMYSQMLGVYEYWITFAEMMYMYVDIVNLKKKMVLDVHASICN